VVNAFAAKGISLHIDAGKRFSSSFDPSNFNLGGGNLAGSIPFYPCTDFGAPLRAGCNNFYDAKNTNFDVRRRFIFHYALFANSQVQTGASGSSGIAEINGNDLMISMGAWGFTTNTPTATNTLINWQAGTLLHEFGHNLGLRHGGNENLNYKPNYVSSMNYMYQLHGIPGSTNTSIAYDRYKYYVDGLNGTPRSYCSLQNTACGSSYLIDYSNGSSANLTEPLLLESDVIGRGTSGVGQYADWNLSGVLNPAAYALDLNRDGTMSVLKDYDDWSNINLPFARTASGFQSGSSFNTVQSAHVKRNPMHDHSKTLVTEDAPDAHVFSELRKHSSHAFKH
jgi:hypothetical protein